MKERDLLHGPQGEAAGIRKSGPGKGVETSFDAVELIALEQHYLGEEARITRELKLLEDRLTRKENALEALEARLTQGLNTLADLEARLRQGAKSLELTDPKDGQKG